MAARIPIQGRQLQTGEHLVAGRAVVCDVGKGLRQALGRRVAGIDLFGRAFLRGDEALGRRAADLAGLTLLIIIEADPGEGEQHQADEHDAIAAQQGAGAFGAEVFTDFVEDIGHAVA